MIPMPRKPKKDPDRHKPRKMVPFPSMIHELMSQLAREGRRPLTREFLWAVEEHLRRHGKLPPEE